MLEPSLSVGLLLPVLTTFLALVFVEQLVALIHFVFLLNVQASEL